MNQTAIEKKIFNIQSELDFLKKFFIKKPDFDIDEKNWRKVNLEVKRTRKKIYQKFYGKE